MSKKNQKADYSVNCVALMCSLFELFAKGVEELGVTELSQLLRIHRNKATKLLFTLETRRYLERNSSTGGYRLGYKAVAMRASFVRSRKLIGQARPFLEKLAAACGETVILAARIDGEIICEDMVESTYSVRAVCPIGRSLAGFSAAGRILSADTGQELIKRGYCVDAGDNDPEVVSVAAPVRDHAGTIVAAVGVLGPSIRLGTQDLIAELALTAKGTAQDISLRMGYLAPAGQVVPLPIYRQPLFKQGIPSAVSAVAVGAGP